METAPTKEILFLMRKDLEKFLTEENKKILRSGYLPEIFKERALKIYDQNQPLLLTKQKQEITTNDYIQAKFLIGFIMEPNVLKLKESVKAYFENRPEPFKVKYATMDRSTYGIFSIEFELEADTDTKVFIYASIVPDTYANEKTHVLIVDMLLLPHIID